MLVEVYRYLFTFNVCLTAICLFFFKLKFYLLTYFRSIEVFWHQFNVVSRWHSSSSRRHGFEAVTAVERVRVSMQQGRPVPLRAMLSSIMRWRCPPRRCCRRVELRWRETNTPRYRCYDSPHREECSDRKRTQSDREYRETMVSLRRAVWHDARVPSLFWYDPESTGEARHVQNEVSFEACPKAVVKCRALSLWKVDLTCHLLEVNKLTRT